MKRPSFQWYPADWKNNAKLQRCSFALRGMWVEIMGLMHDSDEYGVLRWTLTEIARAIGCRLKDLQELRAKGVLKGADPGEVCPAYVFTPNHAGKSGQPITLITEQTGPIWFSSRMVLDEYKRTTRATKGGIGESPKATPKPTIGAPLGEHPTGHHSRAGTRVDAPARASSSSSSTSSGGSNTVGGEEPSLAVQMAVALRSMGVKNASSMNPDIDEWARTGVTLPQAKEAARIAIEDRGIKQPSVRYLVGILNDIRNPSAPRLNGHGKPWFIDTWAAIVAKGAEKGLNEADFETSPAFRAAVLKAHGITADQAAKAEADWKQVA